MFAHSLLVRSQPGRGTTVARAPERVQLWVSERLEPAYATLSVWSEAGAQVDAGDAALLAARGVAVVLCPRSNRALDVGEPPVPALRAAGVRLCVGTDSLASVDSLDLWDDVLALRQAFPALEPAWLVHAATRAGADALGFGELGRIARGAAAAFAFAEGPREIADPLAFLVSGEARPRGVRP